MNELDIKTHEVLKDCNSFMNSIQKLSLKDIREFGYNLHTKIDPIQKELHDRLIKDSKNINTCAECNKQFETEKIWFLCSDCYVNKIEDTDWGLETECREVA